jgi:hypothetical protein
VAYGIIFSERVMLFMMIFPMKAKYFVMLLAAIEFISTVFYSKSGIANSAHLGGMIAGFMYLFLMAYSRVRKKQKGVSRVTKLKNKFSARGHLKLVVNNEIMKDFDQEDEKPGRGSNDDGPQSPTFH